MSILEVILPAFLISLPSSISVLAFPVCPLFIDWQFQGLTHSRFSSLTPDAPWALPAASHSLWDLQTWIPTLDFLPEPQPHLSRTAWPPYPGRLQLNSYKLYSSSDSLAWSKGSPPTSPTGGENGHHLRFLLLPSSCKFFLQSVSLITHSFSLPVFQIMPFAKMCTHHMCVCRDVHSHHHGRPEDSLGLKETLTFKVVVFFFF